MHNVVDELDNDYASAMEMECIVYILNKHVNEVWFEPMDNRNQMVRVNFAFSASQFHEIEFVEIMFRNMETLDEY